MRRLCPLVVLFVLLLAAPTAAAGLSAKALRTLLEQIDRRYAGQSVSGVVVGILRRQNRLDLAVHGRVYCNGRTSQALLLRKEAAFLIHARETWSYGSWVQSTMWPAVEPLIFPPRLSSFKPHYIGLKQLRGRDVHVLGLTRWAEYLRVWIDAKSGHVLQYKVFAGSREHSTYRYTRWRRGRGNHWYPTRVDYQSVGLFPRLSILNINQAARSRAHFTKSWIRRRVRTMPMARGEVKAALESMHRRIVKTAVNALGGQVVGSRPQHSGGTVGPANPRVVFRTPVRALERRALRTAFGYSRRGRHGDALRVLESFITRFPTRPRPRRARAILKAGIGLPATALNDVNWWRKAYGDVSGDDLLDSVARAYRKHPPKRGRLSKP